MGFLDILKGLFGGQNQTQQFSQPSIQSHSQPEMLNPCSNNCGRTVSFNLHPLCKECWTASNPKSWWEVSNSRKNAYNNIASWYTIGQTTEDEVRHNLTAEAGWYSGVDELIASPVFRDIMQWDSQ